ncbi:streptomycin biosynthesis protein StrI [Podospora fimiseda]|uniref:Streptomycin biosynthesis protein StrI n=1 Tax=Podospora fimiseda TaxID=252190 RepID=A0AAN7BQU0_9PEZI|nr:streptomycin biosynthesis protein StrI [Podospora fimiseda]
MEGTGDTLRHRKPRFLVIGAGRHGTAYASAVYREKLPAIIAAVAEPVHSTRISFGKKYIWQDTSPREDQTFDSWQHFLNYEKNRRKAEAAGEKVPEGIDGIIICTQDHTHKEILQEFSPFKLHVLCEKPIATSLKDCQDIYISLGANKPETIFSTGHVLRYSPHNMLLRKLLLEDRVIGELISIEHTEPVRNWRKESVAVPSLLCKSCHDIDFILWLLCYKTDFDEPAHLPTSKPAVAGTATNCFSCPHERNCDLSAKKLYVEKLYDKGERDWPICVVVPDIEDITAKSGDYQGRAVLTEVLSEDYDASTPKTTIESKQWEEFSDRGPKTAVFHMAAFTEAQSKRRGKISGTHGEIQYDSDEFSVFTFDKFQDPEAVKVCTPPKAGGGHGGGDGGLMDNFSRAVEAVINGKLSVEEAQAEYVGCTLKKAFMSHAMVFAAEEARLGRKVVDWCDWWGKLEERLIAE